MKQFTALLLLLCLFLTLAACGAAEIPASSGAAESSTTSDSIPGQSEEVPASSEPEADANPAELYEITTSYANAYRNALGEVWVQAVVAVTNTSEHALCLDYSTLSVQVAEDEICELNYVLAFPDVIAPGETGYYYEEAALNYEAEGMLPLTATLSITETPEAPERFTMSECSITDSPYGGLRITGTLSDPAAQEGKLVYLAVVLFDSNDLPLAVCYTIHTETGNVEDSYELISFMLPESITADCVARAVTFAFPYHFEAAR